MIVNISQISCASRRIPIEDSGALSFRVFLRGIASSATTSPNALPPGFDKAKVQPHESAPGKPPEVEPDTSRSTGKKKAARVLIADDAPSVRESLAKVLRVEGYEVEVAADGRELIEKFISGPTDVVLMDLDMPVVNGWDTFERLLAINPEQAIIIITGRPEPRQWEDASRAGILMAKPIRMPELLEWIQEALNEAKHGRAARISAQRAVTRHSRPIPETSRWQCYKRGGLNE